MEEVRIFTTPLLDGIAIKEYKGAIVVRDIRAMDFVRDMMTRLREFFGGRSGSYMEMLDKLEREAMGHAVEKARAMGANAIIGFDIEFSSVEAMLMATVKGTAVVI
jgi:uncharacterized protein YbjQ (UPF0145 family)